VLCKEHDEERVNLGEGSRGRIPCLYGLATLWYLCRMVCVAHRTRQWAGLASFGLALLLLGCKGSDRSSGGCVHPCDLAQCVSIEVSGPIPASEVYVSSLCHVSQSCPRDTGCRSVGVCLNASYGLGDNPSCLVTVISVHGEVVEKEFVAEFMGSSCCGGYQFPTDFVRVTFDGAADAVARDGNPTGFEDAQYDGP
jgi:hypothetical protein